MSCEQCIDGFCKRRGVALPEGALTLCALRKVASDVLDMEYGIADAAIIPDSQRAGAAPEIQGPMHFVWPKTHPQNIPAGGIVSPASRQSRVSSIGTKLKAIFIRELGESGPCSACSQMIFDLDGMTMDQVQVNRDAIISQIASRAASTAPSWWQRLAIVIDQSIHLGETERRIGVWLDEACVMANVR